ncbi:myeloid cell surface antigen CD33-like [Urocitellus parryii]
MAQVVLVAIREVAVKILLLGLCLILLRATALSVGLTIYVDAFDTVKRHFQLPLRRLSLLCSVPGARTLCLQMLRLLLLLSLLWAVEGACAEGLRSVPSDDHRLPQRHSLQDSEHSMDVPESVTVQEGLCVLVPCRFSYRGSRNGKVFVSWFRAGDDTDHSSAVATNSTRKVSNETQGRFRLLLDPGTNNCSLSIKDTKRSDRGSYFFRLEKGNFKWNYCEKMVSVHVTALTHTPDILVPGTLESCHPSNLTCSVPWACEQGTPPTFSWVGPSVSSLGPNIIHSSVLTLTPRLQDHGTNLTCQVKFPAAGVTTERTIQLNISHPPAAPVWHHLLSQETSCSRSPLTITCYSAIHTGPL